LHLAAYGLEPQPDVGSGLFHAALKLASRFTSVLVEVGGKFVTVSNRLLDRLTVCHARELSVASGDRLLLKANRKLASGGRVTNGELVTVKRTSRDSY